MPRQLGGDEQARRTGADDQNVFDRFAFHSHSARLYATSRRSPPALAGTAAGVLREGGELGRNTDEPAAAPLNSGGVPGAARRSNSRSHAPLRRGTATVLVGRRRRQPAESACGCPRRSVSAAMNPPSAIATSSALPHPKPRRFYSYRRDLAYFQSAQVRKFIGACARR
jgi:hypothetical protein